MSDTFFTQLYGVLRSITLESNFCSHLKLFPDNDLVDNMCINSDVDSCLTTVV